MLNIKETLIHNKREGNINTQAPNKIQNYKFDTLPKITIRNTINETTNNLNIITKTPKPSVFTNQPIKRITMQFQDFQNFALTTEQTTTISGGSWRSIRNSLLTKAIEVLTPLVGENLVYENSGFDAASVDKFCSLHFVPATSESTGKSASSSDEELGFIQISVYVNSNSTS